MAGVGCLMGAASACTQPEPDPGGRVQQGVLYGDPSGPEDDAIVMVSAARPDGSTWHCSGSLIAPNLLVTARHCISSFETGAFSCTDDGELVLGSEGGEIGQPILPDEIDIRVGVGPFPPITAHGLETFIIDTLTICRNDIAAVLIDPPIADVQVLPIRLGRGTLPGEKIRAVGYGQDEEGNAAARRTRSDLTIAEVGTSQFRPEGDLVPARTFLTKGPSLCPGDSGGPALSSTNAIVGLYSQVVGDCMDINARNYFTELAPFEEDLLVPAFEAAEAEPVREADPAAGGASGEGNVEGTAGRAGSPEAPAGSAGSSGAPSQAAGGADPGTAGAPASPTGGTSAAGVAGTAGAAEAAPAYRGPRKKGGCTCRAAGEPLPAPAGAWLLGVAAFALGARRQRRPSTNLSGTCRSASRLTPQKIHSLHTRMHIHPESKS
jgi:MYXO-CTERM domain-containing protein